MSTLQEVLTLLLGAESEARRKAEESKSEAEKVIGKARLDYQREREDRITAAREQAGALIESAGNAAEAEVSQILALGRQEAGGMAERFETHARDTVDAMVNEIALGYIRKGTR